MSEPTQPVAGFEATSFAHRGHTRRVFLAGTGPAIVVVHEVPGLHPGVIAFGQRLVAAGFTVYLASLFGQPGAPPTNGATIRAIGRVCVAREFTPLADRTSPVSTGCGRWPRRPRWTAADPASARSVCASPGGSPSRWPSNRPSLRPC